MSTICTATTKWVELLQNTLRWRLSGRDSVSNHQPHDCLLNRLFRCRSKKTSKLRVTGLCVGNSPGTGEFPAQMASKAENVSIWWRHHEIIVRYVPLFRYTCFELARMYPYLIHTTTVQVGVSQFIFHVVHTLFLCAFPYMPIYYRPIMH